MENQHIQRPGEEPETVEMGDTEILHPGAVGDQLLREAQPHLDRTAIGFLMNFESKSKQKEMLRSFG